MQDDEIARSSIILDVGFKLRLLSTAFVVPVDEIKLEGATSKCCFYPLSILETRYLYLGRPLSQKAACMCRQVELFIVMQSFRAISRENGANV